MRHVRIRAHLNFVVCAHARAFNSCDLRVHLIYACVAHLIYVALRMRAHLICLALRMRAHLICVALRMRALSVYGALRTRAPLICYMCAYARI